jgi:2-dehydropantoate 2-reductase
MRRIGSLPSWGRSRYSGAGPQQERRWKHRGGVVQKGRQIRATFGELNGGISPRVKTLADTLSKDGIDAVPSGNILGEIWDKYVSFAGHSGISALTRLPLGALWACPETRDLMNGIMDEVRALARAKGIALPEGSTERVVSRSSSLAGVYPSTYFDFIAGKRLENEANYGTATRLGLETGVPTPICSTIYALLKPFENGPPEMAPAVRQPAE